MSDIDLNLSQVSTPDHNDKELRFNEYMGSIIAKIPKEKIDTRKLYLFKLGQSAVNRRLHRMKIAQILYERRLMLPQIEEMVKCGRKVNTLDDQQLLHYVKANKRHPKKPVAKELVLALSKKKYDQSKLPETKRNSWERKKY